LRHTFGTRMIAQAEILRVQEWMGHADIHTTRRYLHFRPQHDDANLVAEAFAVDEPTVPPRRAATRQRGGPRGPLPDAAVARALRACTNPPRSTSASPSTSRCSLRMTWPSCFACRARASTSTPATGTEPFRPVPIGRHRRF